VTVGQLRKQCFFRHLEFQAAEMGVLMGLDERLRIATHRETGAR